MNEPNYFQNPNSKFLLNVVQEGDGLELLRDLKDNSVQLVIFDPQYKNAQQTQPKTKPRCKTGGPTPLYYPFPNLEQSENDIQIFLQQIKRILKSNGFCLLWVNQTILLNQIFPNWLPENLKASNLLIWTKGNYLGLGHNHFRSQSEYCLLIQKNPYRKEIKNKGIGNVFSEIINFGGRHNIHEKPYQMTEIIIQQLTNEGDLVVDPCAGSFVSLRACQNLNRDFLGTDLTLRKLMKFNINKERSRKLLKQEKAYFPTNLEANE